MKQPAVNGALTQGTGGIAWCTNEWNIFKIFDNYIVKSVMVYSFSKNKGSVWFDAHMSMIGNIL